jgi:hypothetical protein
LTQFAKPDLFLNGRVSYFVEQVFRLYPGNSTHAFLEKSKPFSRFLLTPICLIDTKTLRRKLPISLTCIAWPIITPLTAFYVRLSEVEKLYPNT